MFIFHMSILLIIIDDHKNGDGYQHGTNPIQCIQCFDKLVQFDHGSNIIRSYLNLFLIYCLSAETILSL